VATNLRGDDCFKSCILYRPFLNLTVKNYENGPHLPNLLLKMVYLSEAGCNTYVAGVTVVVMCVC